MDSLTILNSVLIGLGSTLVVPKILEMKNVKPRYFWLSSIFVFVFLLNLIFSSPAREDTPVFVSWLLLALIASLPIIGGYAFVRLTKGR